MPGRALFGSVAALGAAALLSCTGFGPRLYPREDGGAEAGVDSGEDAEASEDADLADSPCLPDPDADADSDAEADADREPGPDAEADADADDERDAEWPDAEPDGGADADLEPCPSDMVAAGSFCVDVYEASRSDATASSQGSATGLARSVAGVVPWHVNPMSAAALAEFAAGCAAAGKRLCTPEEIGTACEGPGRTTFTFGDAFDREACNCVDTFCDDYCAAHPEVSPCSLAPDCGYAHGCFHVVPTGSMPGCTNGFGAFDLSGNVWEVAAPSASDPRGYEVRAGAFNCASAASRLACSYNAGWLTLYAGFRCCRDR